MEEENVIAQPIEDDSKPIIWVVDEVDEDLDTTVFALRRDIQKVAPIEVGRLPALRRKEDYLEIVANPDTAALILDHKLQTRGGVDHTGIELALFLRNVVPDLPIYILTAYTTKEGEPNDEFDEVDWSVEDVLDKTILNNPSEKDRFVKRLIRQINVFRTISDQREKRFQALLVLSLERPLSAEEQEEYNRISFDRLGALALSEKLQERQLDQAFDRLQVRLKELLDSDE